MQLKLHSAEQTEEICPSAGAVREIIGCFGYSLQA